MSKRFLSGINVIGGTTLNGVTDAGVDTDKFIVLDSNGVIRYRTGDEILSDVGAVSTARTLSINGTSYDLSADRSWTISTSSSARSIQKFVATANQTTFTITGGYTVGLVDVYVNGVKLDNSGDFTATNGSTIVLTTGTLVNNIVEVYKYINAFTANNALRVSTYFTATAGQTTFAATYSLGLIDVFYNGSKLSTSEYNASSGTSIVFNNACSVNDIIEIIAYNYSVGGFTGVSQTRTITINGTAYDLSADRAWTINNASLGAQPQLNGTGLVRMAGTTVSYDNDTYATQSYVTTAVSNLVNAAPSTLDTLNELATALGNDANFSTTVTTSIGTKQPQLNGTGFVKISGTTISYDNNTYLTTASASSTYQTILTNPITGSGTATRVAFFNGANSVTSSSGFYWDNVNGRVAIGKNSADARLEVYGSTKGQIRVNGGPSLGAGIDFYTELAGADRRNWAIMTEDQLSGDFAIKTSASAGASPTLQKLTITKEGEVSVYSYFNIINSDQTVMYFNNTGRAGGAGRNWSILNGNLGAGIFSIKDETAAANRFSIATDGVATTYISALIGIATDASAYMRISENQIWRTGAGALYINNSGTGQVIIATGGGALTLGTDTQVGTNFITTKNAGITGSNTYFGTGQVRIGGGSDHTTNTVLSVAPGIINFDRPGIAGGVFKTTTDGYGVFGIRLGVRATPEQPMHVNQAVTAVNQGIPATSGTTQNGILRLTPAVGLYGETLDFGMNVGPSYGWIQPTNKDALSTNYDFVLNPNGGNIGLGTKDIPGDHIVQICNRAQNYARFALTNTTTGNASGDGLIFQMENNLAIIKNQENDRLCFGINGRETDIVINGNGVVGIGVSPTGTWTTRSAIMLGAYGTALSSYNGGGGATELLHNATVTSGFSYTYAITAASTKQYMDGNNIIWFRAPIGTQGAAITYTELMNISSSGLGINTGGSSNLRLTVSEAGSTISSGNVTFASQAKGIELYNQNSGTTDNLVGYWLSTGPHKAGIASGRTNAASNWAVDLRFFVHGPEIAALDNTYEKMRLYGEGNLTINGSLTQTGALSDITLKENLVKIVTPLQKISQISGYTFTWKENAPARQHISNIVEDAGLIAQEVELILPEIVRTNGDGSKALNYNGVVGLLVEAIKELKAEIDILKAR